VITPPEFNVGPFDVSPDGRSVAAEMSRSAWFWELWLVQVETGKTEIVGGDGDSRSSPAWSPTNGRLAYWKDEARALFVRDRDGRERQITSSFPDERQVTSSFPEKNNWWSIDWTPDEQFVRRSTGPASFELWPADALTPNTTPARSVLSVSQDALEVALYGRHEAVLEGRHSPDGRFWVFVVATGGDDLASWVNPKTGVFIALAAKASKRDEWTAVANTFEWTRAPRWSSDGKTLYFLAAVRKNSNISVWGQRIDRSSGKPIDEPFQVIAPPPRQAISSERIDLGVGRGQLVLPMSSESGSLWVVEDVGTP